MPVILKEITINNFKSLKDITVSLKKFNVLVGPNGSGKTNFTEFFKFLKRSLVVTQSPYAPYLDWWDYKNIVWQRKEELPITAKICCTINGIDVEYSVAFSGIGGLFKILTEKLEFSKALVFEREGPILKITQDADFLRRNADDMQSQFPPIIRFIRLVSDQPPEILNERLNAIQRDLTVDSLSEQIVKFPRAVPNLLHLRTSRLPRLGSPKDKRESLKIRGESIGYLDEATKRDDFALIFYPSEIKGHRIMFNEIIYELLELIQGITILRHPNIKDVKTASLPRKEESLSEDSSNLNSVLYQWFKENGKLPDRITSLLSQLFPAIQIGFESTFDGRIYIKLKENNIELHPPSIPDGLYKILAILSAIELKPSLLAIDEIENSLHKEALEYVIDELRNCGSTVIMTTHSPLVVDIVRLEDLLIVEKVTDGTKLFRIKEPEKAREKLAELKITQSESWLYGELPQ